MKNSIVLICFVLGLVSSANAQKATRNVQFGVEGGYDFLSVRSTSPFSEFTDHSSYQLTTFLQFKHPKKKFAFNMGLSYQKMNLTVFQPSYPYCGGITYPSEQERAVTGGYSKHNVDFVGVPINYRYYFPLMNSSFFANIGVTPFFKRKSEAQYWERICGVITELELNPNYHFVTNSIIHRINIGAGWNFYLTDAKKVKFHIYPKISYFSSGIVKNAYFSYNARTNEISHVTSRIDRTFSLSVNSGFIF